MISRLIRTESLYDVLDSRSPDQVMMWLKDITEEFKSRDIKFSIDYTGRDHDEVAILNIMEKL